MMHVLDYREFMAKFSNFREAEVWGLCGWEPEAIILVDPSDKALVQAVIDFFTTNDSIFNRFPNTGIFMVRQHADALMCKLSL